MANPTETPSVDQNLLYLLGQIDAKVTHLLAGHGAITLRLDKQEERIKRVEQGHWKVAGVIGVVPVAVAILSLWLSFNSP